MRSVMLPKTHMLLFTQVWRRGFHCLDGTGKNVFNTMPDRSFRPMSVNAWFNISVMCQKKWFSKKQTEEIGHKTNQLWVHLCRCWEIIYLSSIILLWAKFLKHECFPRRCQIQGEAANASVVFILQSRMFTFALFCCI